jgi:hypothetical protein
MAYIGAEPSYGIFDRQVITGDGSTTTYQLDYPVSLLLKHCLLLTLILLTEMVQQQLSR